MTNTCSKCGAFIDPEWTACHDCGATWSREHTLVEHHPLPPVQESAPAKRAFGGLLFGVVIAPAFIIVGTMLCLTGLGAFLGIPMIIAGALAPILGPMMGIDMHAGKCPWCEAKVSIVPLVDAFDCPACHRKITVKNHRDMVQAA